jgi:DNA-binding transcriptional LysR family regulator
LEDWVGARLIDRSGQPASLTTAGEVFKPVAREIVHLAYQSRNSIITQLKADEEKIRFSTVQTLAQFFLPGWLKKLQSVIETTSFSVTTDYASIDDYLFALEDGIEDFFICYEDPTGNISNDTKKFCSHKLGTEFLVPVVSPDSDGKPACWLPSCKPGSSVPYLLTKSKPSLWPIKHHLETRYSDLVFIPVYEASIATALKDMVIEGYGVAWIPNSIIVDDLATGTLVRAAEESDDILVDIKIYRYEQNTEPRAEKFWQIIMQQETL